MWLLLNLLSAFFLLCNSQGKYTKINSKAGNIIFKYREGISGERKLHECRQYETCNIVHERFWLPILVERMCRCPNGFECPWSGEQNDYSMMLNNRSLLKFCEPRMKNKTCTRKQTAAVIRGKINTNHTAAVPHKIQINCQCPRTHYWKLQKYTFGDEDDSLYQVFRCLKQTMCDKLEFCGYIRADLFSVYYRCTCPEGNLCVSKDRDKENVQEMLYTGPAYKAYCIPWK